MKNNMTLIQFKKVYPYVFYIYVHIFNILYTSVLFLRLGKKWSF